MEPIRVLCVFSTLDRGGAESMCMNLYRKIDKSKVQFDFVKHTHNKCAFDDEILSLGGRIFEAPRYKMYNIFQYRKWWKRFFQKHPEYRIIHGHWFSISAICFKIAHNFGCITIGHSHCTKGTENGTLKSILRTWIKTFHMRKLEKNSDYCFACSTPAGEWVFPNKEFTVLNNAIDTNKFKFDVDVRKRVRNQLHIDKNFVIGAVGRIMYQKNPLGIVEIFKSAQSRIPNAKLLWVGDGPMREEAENKLKEYGLFDCVIMTGVRSDVNELMQAMDVFVFPSFYEGLPVVSVEAQAAGLPCLLSEGITREAKITERCTFLPIDNFSLWANEIENLQKCERTDTRKSIIDSGYDINETSKWLENFYLKISED